MAFMPVKLGSVHLHYIKIMFQVSNEFNHRIFSCKNSKNTLWFKKFLSSNDLSKVDSMKSGKREVKWNFRKILFSSLRGVINGMIFPMLNKMLSYESTKSKRNSRKSTIIQCKSSSVYFVLFSVWFRKCVLFEQKAIFSFLCMYSFEFK